MPDPEDPARSGLFGRRAASRLREADAALEARLRQLDESAAELARAAAELDRREDETRDVLDEIERRLAADSAELDAREAALESLAAQLGGRESDLERREASIEERARELGAVELRRASLERREEALATRERSLPALSTAADTSSHVLFLPGVRYSLAERAGPPPPLGGAVEIDGRAYVVMRLGASPLPGDGRRCAFLTLRET